MNSIEEFRELEAYVRDYPDLLPEMVEQAYLRVDEFGDYYRAFFILYRRAVKVQKVKN